MYLHDSFSNGLTLKLRTNEPELVRYFSRIFPARAFSNIYGLDQAKGDEWYGDMYSLGDEILNNPGVSETRVEFNTNLFNEWIYSGDGDFQNKIDNIPLRKFHEAGVSLKSIMSLCYDSMCNNCDDDHAEPAPIFIGTESSEYKIYEAYKSIKNVLNSELTEAYTDMDGCFICKPTEFPITPAMRRYARFRPGTCECMPCRRGL